MGSIWRACVNQWGFPRGLCLRVCVWGEAGVLWFHLAHAAPGEEIYEQGNDSRDYNPTSPPWVTPKTRPMWTPGELKAGRFQEWCNAKSSGHTSWRPEPTPASAHWPWQAASGVGKVLENHFIRSKVKCFKAPTRDTQSKLTRNP